MKKSINKFIYSFAAIVGFATVSIAQDNKSDELGKIALATYIPAQESMSEQATNMLTNKLGQIISTNGIAKSSYNSRFIITANANVMTKDLLATAPPMTALTLDVTLYIGDGIDGKKFASKSLTLKGVGTNETKAYIDAMKNINQNDAGIQSFVTNGKNKIVEYYKANCSLIIKEAQLLEKQNRFDEAIFMLTSVPAECTDCYNKTMAIIPSMYKKMIDRDCKVKLMEANNLWNATQDYDTAMTVGGILSSIDPASACVGEAKALSAKVGKRVIEIDKREWNLNYEKEVGLQKDLIKAYRDVGVAYGNGQPKSVTYNVVGWW
ncbi:hypothetical protein [Flavobacterium sp.]|uniref:hypothetical protein n=1 Tax=Flavobacterium sp. TaxID=239 RepID=UPI0026250A4C|nr:hypothetical protein [Flavobacterium sp.]